MICYFDNRAHLGGFTSFDPMGVSPTLWTHMISHLGIRSLLDLGCGRGISTSWFITHGLEYVVCAEGSHDAVTQSLLPQIKDLQLLDQVLTRTRISTTVKPKASPRGFGEVAIINTAF